MWGPLLGHQRHSSHTKWQGEESSQAVRSRWRKRLLFFCFLVILSWASLVAQLVKNLSAMQETWVLSLWLGRSPGEGNGNPLQYSCLENPMDRGIWWATVCEGHKELDATEHKDKHGLNCSMHVGSSQIRDQTHVSCAGKRIAYHWATRQALEPSSITGNIKLLQGVLDEKFNWKWNFHKWNLNEKDISKFGKKKFGK